MDYYDLNGDGITDAIYVDQSGDGYIDAYLFDNNQDGYYEVVAGDADQNGSLELVISDVDVDGDYESVWADTDNNGDYETVFNTEANPASATYVEQGTVGGGTGGSGMNYDALANDPYAWAMWQDIQQSQYISGSTWLLPDGYEFVY